MEIAVDGFDLLFPFDEIETVQGMAQALEILTTTRHFIASVTVRSPISKNCKKKFII